MNQDELIEKCRLTPEERHYYHEQARRIANDLANSTEGNFKQEDIEAIYDDAERAMIDAQLRKAIPIIEAEVRKAERRRFLEWLNNRRATDTAMDIYLQAEQALKGEGDE